MTVRDEISKMHEEMISWRQELHQHPATAFEETYISDFVQKKLREFGVEYKNGYGKTGIVAQIKGQNTSSNRSIGLRADMDALDINEETALPYQSKNPGKMHACGHDGHTTMLLGAAKYLKENPDFNGTINLIFQPAEETLMGASSMLQDGLLDDFPCDQIYGMHNWPWIAMGKFGMRHEALMAAVTYLEITITGKAGHSGMINNATDPVLIGAEIITSIQSLISQNKDPFEPAIIYFPIFETGVTDAGVVPEKVVLKGVMRTFSVGLKNDLLKKTHDICNHIAAAHGGTASVYISCDCDEVFNAEETTETSRKVAASIVGNDNVDMNYNPVLSGEDFGIFSKQVPSTFIFIGQQEPDDLSGPCSHSIHSPYYDFNDKIIPLGTEYWVKLVETSLPL